jgi:hypothetical protein
VDGFGSALTGTVPGERGGLMTYPPPGETPEPYQPPQQPDPFAQPDPYGTQPPYSAQPYSGQPYSGQPYPTPPDPYGAQPYGVQPPAGAPGYGTPPPYAPGYRTTRGTNGLAIASLVCSLVGLFTCLGAPLGIVLGHVAKGQLKTSGEDGDGLATAGLITGYIVVVLYLGFCGLAAASGMLSSYNN